MLQVWQWIRHGAKLEESGQTVTIALVREEMRLVMEEEGGQDWEMVGEVFMDIVTRRKMPEFITTLLSDSYLFRYELAKKNEKLCI